MACRPRSQEPPDDRPSPAPSRIRSSSPARGSNPTIRSIVANPADPAHPAGSTFHATEAQYEQAVEAAVAAFEVTRNLPAYERGAILRNISAGIKARREELGRLIATGGRQADPRRPRRGRPGRGDLPARRRGGRADGRARSIPLDLMPRRARAGWASPGASRSARSPGSARSTSRSTWPPTRSSPAIATGQPDRPQAAVQGPAHDAHRRRDHRGGRRAGGLASASCR